MDSKNLPVIDSSARESLQAGPKDNEAMACGLLVPNEDVTALADAVPLNV